MHHVGRERYIRPKDRVSVMTGAASGIGKEIAIFVSDRWFMQ